ncbi:MAG: 50S ribosomal protein L18 [Nitrososphaerales archaeon]
MNIQKSYIPIFRRRREGKTDYKKRRLLLYGKKPFITFHKSNYTIYCQIHKPELKGDVVIASANSKELTKYGWKGSRKNIPSAYLTGLLVGLRALEKGVKSAVLYLGPRRFVKGSRVTALVKGIIDAGVDVPVDPELLPKEEYLSGKHISEYANMLLSSSPEEYKRRFSFLLSRRFKPEEYAKHTALVKSKLFKELKVKAK